MTIYRAHEEVEFEYNEGLARAEIHRVGYLFSLFLIHLVRAKCPAYILQCLLLRHYVVPYSDIH